MLNNLDFFIIFFLMISIFGIGIRKISHTETSYLVADRQIGFFALTATLVMTELNTATLLGFSSLGYLAGFWSLSLPFVFLIGLFFYAITVAKKWKSFDGLSVSAFFEKRYGKGIGKFASMSLLIAMAVFSGTYVKSLVTLSHPLFPNSSEWILSGIFAIFAFLMTARGGLISIIYTDVISFIVTISFFPMMVFFSWKGSDSLIPSIQEIFQKGSTKIPVWYVTSLTFLTMFTYILAPWYGQKMFAAKSKRVAYLAVILAAIIVFFLYGCAVLTTAFLQLRQVPISNSEEALPFVLHHFLPNGLKGVGYTVFFIASVTTLTGVWSAMTAMVIGDFFQGKLLKNSTRSIFITFLFAMISFLLSNLFVDHILNKLILANIPIAALSFSLLAGFFWEKASQFGAYLSISVGLICGIGFYIYFGEKGGYIWYWAIEGLPLIFLSGILGSYLVPTKEKSGMLVEGHKTVI